MQGRADERADAGPDPTEPPKRNRTIIILGLVLCIVAAVVAAYVLGWLDRSGALS
jgi:uncharacterized protein involved in exopolysaccharide biosynthesis